MALLPHKHKHGSGPSPLGEAGRGLSARCFFPGSAISSIGMQSLLDANAVPHPLPRGASPIAPPPSPHAAAPFVQPGLDGQRSRMRSPSQRTALANAAHCVGHRGALRWPSRRAAFFCPLPRGGCCRVPSVGGAARPSLPQSRNCASVRLRRPTPACRARARCPAPACPPRRGCCRARSWRGMSPRCPGGA